MKYFIFFCLVCISIYSEAQDIPDSLNKYSYSVVGISGGKPTMLGTGFFIKKDNRLFFITAYHVATGIHVVGGSPSPPVRVDSIGIAHYIGLARTFPLYNFTATYRNIDNEKEMKNFKRGDLYIAEIDTTTIMKGLPINEISKLIDEKYFDVIPLEVYSFGYEDDRFIGDANIKGKTFIGEYKKEKPSFRDTLTSEESSEAKDFFNIMFEFSNKSKDSLRPGISGSPVWGKFLIDHQIEYKLIGIVFGNSYYTGNGFVVKGKEILIELNLKLSKHPNP